MTDLRARMQRHDAERTERLHALLTDYLAGRTARRRGLPLKLDDYAPGTLEVPWLLEADRAAEAGEWGPFLQKLFVEVLEAGGELRWAELATVHARRNEGSLFLGRRHGQRGVLRWDWEPARLPPWVRLATAHATVEIEVISRVVVGATVGGPVPLDALKEAWAAPGGRALRRLDLRGWSGPPEALLAAMVAAPWPRLTELAWPVRPSAAEEAALRGAAPDLHTLQLPAPAATRPVCSPSHAQRVANLLASLHRQLAGSGHRLFATGLPVQAPGLRIWPDCTVTRGTPTLTDGALLDPVLLCEVLEPGSEGEDRGHHFTRLAELPALQEFLLVDWREPLVQRFARDGDGWRLSMVRAGERLALTSVPATLDVDAVFTDVALPGD